VVKIAHSERARDINASDVGDAPNYPYQEAYLKKGNLSVRIMGKGKT